MKIITRLTLCILLVVMMLSSVNAATEFFEMTAPGSTTSASIVSSLDCVTINPDDVKFMSYYPAGKFDNLYPRLVIQTNDMLYEIEFVDGKCTSRSEYVDWERSWSSIGGMDTVYNEDELEYYPEFFMPNATPTLVATEGDQIYNMYASPIYCQSPDLKWSRDLDSNSKLCDSSVSFTQNFGYSIGAGYIDGQCCGEPEDIFETYESARGICYKGNWFNSNPDEDLYWYFKDPLLSAKDKVFEEVLLTDSSTDKLIACGVRNDVPGNCSCNEILDPGCCDNIINLTRGQKPYQGQSNMLERSIFNYNDQKWEPWQIIDAIQKDISNLDDSLEIQVGGVDVEVFQNLSNLMAGRIYNFNMQVKGSSMNNESIGQNLTLFYRIKEGSSVRFSMNESVEILNDEYQSIYLLFGVPPYIDWQKGSYTDYEGSGNLLGQPPVGLGSLRNADAISGIEIDGINYLMAVRGNDLYVAEIIGENLVWKPGASNVHVDGNGLITAFGIYDDPNNDMQTMHFLRDGGNTIYLGTFDGFDNWPDLKDFTGFSTTITNNIKGSDMIDWSHIDQMEIISGDKIIWILMDSYNNKYYISDFTDWFKIHKNYYGLWTHNFTTGSLDEFYDLIGEDSTPDWPNAKDGAIIYKSDIPYWYVPGDTEFYSSMFYIDDVKPDGLLGANWMDSKYYDFSKYTHQVGLMIQGNPTYTVNIKEPRVASNDYLLKLKKGVETQDDPSKGDPLITRHYDYCELLDNPADSTKWSYYCDISEGWIHINQSDPHSNQSNLTQDEFGIKYVPYDRWLEYKGTAAVNKWIQPMGCCRDDQCWDGKTCHDPDNLNPNAVFMPNGTVEGYLCWIDDGYANWTWMFKDKQYWDNVDVIAGCPNGSMCLVDMYGNRSNNGNTSVYSEYAREKISKVTGDGTNNPVCINNGQYIGDHYCDNGNWTTRTEILAKRLLMYVDDTDDFVLFCDKYNNILNMADINIGQGVVDVTSRSGCPGIADISNNEIIPYYIDNSESLSGNCRTEAFYWDIPGSADDSELAYDNVNNFCVLGYMDGDNFSKIIGTSLNQPINADNYPFQDLLGGTLSLPDPYADDYDTNAGFIGRYDYYYNPIRKIVYFSQTGTIGTTSGLSGSPRADNPIDAIKSWILDIFWDVGNDSITLRDNLPLELNFSSDYSRIFIAHQSGSSRFCNLHGGLCNMTVWGAISESGTRLGNDIYVDSFLQFYYPIPDTSICESIEGLSNKPTNYNCTPYDITTQSGNGYPTILLAQDLEDNQNFYDTIWKDMTAGLRVIR